MRIIIYIALIFTIAGCKPSPDYDPFNEQYDVSVRDIVMDGCDTISAGCGYFNLQVKEGRLRPYYQIFIEDFDEVLAKGFNYYEDTVLVAEIENQFDDNLMETLLRKPIDSIRFNEELARYNYHFLGKVGRQIKIGSVDDGSTLNLYLIFNTLGEDSVVIRQIQYWKSKN